MQSHHGHSHPTSPKRLFWAVVINVLLTIFQIIGGIFSGSLSLLADALHNLSDAGALAIAAIAAKIARIPPNKNMTYGYRRAEILGALINSTTLIIIGIYLVYEAISRYSDQSPIDGWIVIVVASIALAIDIITAFLMREGAKENINFKAAFIHNISDALASVVVIISGVLILNYQIYVIDLIATILISVYVLYQAFFLIKKCILILMQSVPPGINISELKVELGSIPQILGVHHLHIWQLDDARLLLEGHLKIDSSSLKDIETIKKKVRELLKKKYSIEHSTLEIEISDTCPLS